MSCQNVFGAYVNRKNSDQSTTLHIPLWIIAIHQYSVQYTVTL